MPAILVKNEAGVEGPVKFAAVRGEVIIIDGVPRDLRSGKNNAFRQTKVLRGLKPRLVITALASAADRDADQNCLMLAGQQPTIVTCVMECQP
jgi:hypothetical protein